MIIFGQKLQSLWYSIVWPQWWSFVDMSQQGCDFSKKIRKRKIIFWFDFHRCSHGSSKSAWIWLSKSFFYVKNHSNLRRRFFCYFHSLKTSIFEPLCILKWCPIFDSPCEHLWKSNQKNISILLIFLLKSTPCWLTSAKLHHWGHTIDLLPSVTFW